MIYSIKYAIGSRTRSVQFFRDQKWKSLLKCFFDSYYNTKIPVVLLVRFYVTPPAHATVKPADVKKEKTPAVHSYELCDYILSFLEMLHHVLINSYRQVVKIDVEKFYSNNPRTLFKFMKWDHYVKLYRNNPMDPKSKSVSKGRGEILLQPECEGNAKNEAVCPKADRGTETTPSVGTPASDRALPDTGTVGSKWKKTPTAAWIASHKKT